MAKVKIGKFEVLAPLGRGAGSQILKIRRLADGKTYALKKICISEADDRKYYEQAEHEFEVATKFDNPRLEKMYFFEKQTRLFRLSGSHTLLEFIDGRPLASCKGLPLYRLVTIFFPGR